MPETDAPAVKTPESAAGPGPRGKDEVALELMKFVAVTTGYGKATNTGAGFSSKPATRSPEEHAEALLELYERCRRVLNKDV